MSIEEWLAKASDALPRAIKTRCATLLAPLGEKASSERLVQEEFAKERKPQSIRSLPFAQHTFEQICERYSIHGSIVRALTRSDVPVFSCDSLKMKGNVKNECFGKILLESSQGLQLRYPALAVYNCRTPNSWKSDLALSATYNPQSGLAFAIVYGSTFAVEQEILERLRTIGVEAAHPLLLPGIIAELELTRHTGLVDGSISEVEAKILELDVQPSNGHGHDRDEIERRNLSKRTAWLDLTYLRNSLTTWNLQLLKMAEHAGALNRNQFGVSELNDGSTCSTDFYQIGSQHENVELVLEHPTNTSNNKKEEGQSGLNERTHFPGYHDSFEYLSSKQSQDVETLASEESDSTITPGNDDQDFHLEQMRIVGEKIKARITAIRDEYDAKIRDCTMRVDGMAMATQWVNSPPPASYSSS